jgi:hypothetical protein
MKKILLLLALLAGGAVVLRRLLPTHFGERMMGRMLEHMPEN